MRRFRFRLQAVLRLRQQFERRARQDLAAAMGRVAGIDRQIEAASQGLHDCEDQAARWGSVGQLARALETGLRRHRWRLEQQRQQAERDVESARANYHEQVRDLRTLRQLRDRRRSEWLDEVQREEQAELDELSALRAAKVRREGEGAW